LIKEKRLIIKLFRKRRDSKKIYILVRKKRI